MFGGNTCAAANCQAGAHNKDEYELTLAAAGAGGAAAGGGAGLSALDLAYCGVQVPTCDPDDVNSCGYAAPSEGQGGATSNIALPSDGTLPSAGAAGFAADGIGLGILGGASNVGSASDLTRAGTSGVKLACRVTGDQSVSRTTCEPAGQGTLGAPCVSRANCASGFDCAEENGTAQCRPYCCHGVGGCPLRTYCAQRFTKELVATTGRLLVAVCMPAVSCRFDDPFPCPVDKACSCPSGKACGVVRSDGTTACVVPATGVEGEPCPCAAQHVCSDTLGTCFKVCSLTSNDPTCTGGFCQSSTSLPVEWGLCVNSTSLL